ncbi:alanine racemase [Kineosporia sp. J2-2]|uniref:Alanine racemase n=1 Tax=Kineosporia corallincola TaxID=2835133 RepID=A0ABS5TCI3_9ACTN|nr:alanine racemase [Kineosporia corallincola]MBT0767891.1 alanine racemase [Kineosporia corallincola]
MSVSPPVPPIELPEGLPSAAVIDLDAIAANVRALRGHAPGAGLMAVVKADAYGHGLVPAARAALAGGAAWLGTAQLSEALALRAAGLTAPTLSWLTVPGDRYAEAIRQGVDIGVSAGWALAEIAAAAREVGGTARLHLKVDTGLNRNGCTLADWPQLLEDALKLQADGLVSVVGGFSHFVSADEPADPVNARQLENFVTALDLATTAGARFEVRHIANSPATLSNPDAHFDLVRPGLSVYGLSPFPERPPHEFGLRPAMTLLGRVANVKRVAAGQGVSYGHTYVTSTDTEVAVVPLGYGDGIPRHASGTGPVQLGGRRFRVSGRVCMDQVVVDLADGGIGRVAAGDVAVLFGGAPGEPSAQDWAQAAGTINYEIVTRLGARVPRVHTGSAGR